MLGIGRWVLGKSSNGKGRLHQKPTANGQWHPVGTPLNEAQYLRDLVRSPNMKLIMLLGGITLSFSVSAQDQPTSLEPGRKSAVHAPMLHKEVKLKRRKAKHTPEYEFYERVEKAAKEKQRIIKYLNKRQFKDHRYFGHKKIPKRRPPHKMRYCNECGVRH